MSRENDGHAITTVGAAISGCKQNYRLADYNGQLDYVSTNTLHNVIQSGRSRVFKIGIVGTNDGIFRYGETRYPYGRDVIEIVISGWANTQSAGRRQHRTLRNEYSNLQLTAVPTQGLLSPFYPIIILLEVSTTGLVRITKAGDKEPFLEFIDERRIPANYIGFTKHNDNDVIYFYDCPL
uniref:Methyltransf_FA domain-containing protein n=1 Tax=Anopheles albimanus TaxID=7167 RepID=A0A182FI05_ANOAL